MFRYLNLVMRIVLICAGLGVTAVSAQSKELGGEYRGDRASRGMYYRYCDYGRCYDRGHFRRQSHPGIFVDPGIGFGIYFGDTYPRYHVRPRHYIYPRHYIHPRPIIRKARFCTNGRAINKARRLGIHHIRVFPYSHYVLIKGRQHGHRIHVAFGRSRGCPILDY